MNPIWSSRARQILKTRKQLKQKSIKAVKKLT